MNRTTWIIVIGAALFLLLVVGASVITPLVWGRDYAPGWGMMGPWTMGGRFGFPMVGGIMTLLFWGLVIVGVILLVQSLARGSGAGAGSIAPSESPFDVLKRRYAKGEINKEQFEEIKRDLGQ